MLNYLILKTLHVAGVLALVAGAAGLATLAAEGGRKRGSTVYTLLSGLHGVGLAVSLLFGLGMLFLYARDPGMLSPAWAAAKLVLWAALVVAAMVPYRWPSTARWVLAVVLPALALGAVALAILKPF